MTEFPFATIDPTDGDSVQVTLVFDVFDTLALNWPVCFEESVVFAGDTLTCTAPPPAESVNVTLAV